MNQNTSIASKYLVAALPIAVTAMLLATLVHTAQSLRLAQHSVDRVDQAVSADRELLKLNLDMETGLRGFQYTGRSEFLQPYTDAEQPAEARFAELRQLVESNSSQQAQLASMRRSFDQWKLSAASAIQRLADDSMRDSDQVRYEQALERKTSMDNIRAQHKALEAGEALLRSHAVATMKTDEWLLGLTCILIAFGGGGGMAVFLNRQRRRLSAEFRRSIELQQLADAAIKAASREKEEAGALQRAIFNSANFSSIATDEKGVIQIFNVGAERMLGYEAIDVMNQLTPADLSDSQELVARAERLSAELGTFIAPGFEALVFKASRGIEDIYELTYIRKNGSRFQALVSVTALRDTKEAIIGYLLIATDNTARKRAEVELRRSNDKLQMLFDDVKDYAILMLDPEGRVVTWSAGAESIKGYHANEIIGCHFSKFYTAEAIARDVPGYELRTAAQNGRFEHEDWRVRKDGSRFLAHIIITALRDDSGQLVGFGKVTRDITARRRAEEDANALLRTIHLHSIVSVADRAGRIIEVNDSFCAISGYAREELLGQTHRIVNSGFHEPAFWIDMWRNISMGKSWKGEICNRRKDGSLYWVDSIIAPFLGEDGRTTKFISIRTDITAAKLSELRLREQTTQAEVASNTKSDFLANMSHEIRTPMNAILGMTHLALRAQPSAQQKRYLSKIGNAAESLLSIMNDILDFSKIEAGKLDLEQITFSLDEVWNNLVDIVGQKAEQKGIAIVFRVEPDTPRYLRGDPLRVCQILINLVNNAIKFTETGEITVCVKAEDVSPELGRFGFSVSDTGIGMSPEQVSNLFQSFNQADTSFTRKYGGTGLGLAISKQLCELMGGTISVQSDLGRGSTFLFTATFGTASPETPIEARTRLSDLLKKTILIVDDDEPIRSVLIAMLQANGFIARAVASGEEALAAITLASQAGQTIDLVLMDWHLPGIDGIETSRRIKEQLELSHVPAIMMISAFDRERVMATQGAAALDGFLNKPVSETLLIANIAMIFGLQTDDLAFASRSLPTASPTNLAGRKVLLVEDNEINRDLATELLSDLGVSVSIAVNGQQAVDRVLEEAFDMVLMDIQMPIMDGLSATRLIRADARFSALPIIAMTAHAMSGDRERSMSAGMNDHLTKPINPNLLTKTLIRYMPAKGTLVRAEADPGEPTKLSLSASELPDHLPPFNLEIALERANRKPKLLRKLMRGFHDRYGNAAADLREHIAAGRYADAERMAHSLKSVAAMLEAPDLASAAAIVEETLRTGEKESLTSEIDVLEGLLTPAIAAAHSLESGMTAEETTASEPSPSPVRAVTSTASASDRLPCILVVDDDPLSTDVLAHIFSGGYEVLIAGNGRTALEVAALRLPDVILLDVMMPEVNGYEVCRRLKATAATSEIPVIFITGADSATAETKGLQMGASDYITKPVNPTSVKARVDKQIVLKGLQADLTLLASTDGLTGLANRRRFDERLSYEYARHARSGTQLSLIMLDIDFFKAFNDTYGHIRGDECLRQVARAIGGVVVRSTDLAARYGGEEFVLLLPETDLKGAQTLAENARGSVSNLAIPHNFSGGAGYVTASLGVVSARCFPGRSAFDLIAQADRQLYAAKAAGRNQIWALDIAQEGRARTFEGPGKTFAAAACL